VSDITFPVSEELEADLASGDQSLPIGVLGAQSERFPSNLEVEASPQAPSKKESCIHFASGSAHLSTS
jgi:STAGA complex 65 subunit gamma